ncbi:MAG: response regulator [Nitrospirae bacterium]|nr:response regulator [Nitrospirota bacterium]
MRRKESTIISILRGKIFYIGIAVGALYWTLDSIMDTFIFHKGSFFEEMFIPDAMCLWMRLLVWSITIVSGAFVQLIFDKQTATEKSMNEGEDRLKTILSTIQTGIIIIDAKTHEIVDVNPMASKMIGTPREKIVGQICHKFICPAEKGMCPITDLGLEVDNAERQLLMADGRPVPIIKTVVPINLGGRKHLLESFIDIAERKKAEQFSKDILESLTHSLVVINPEYRISSANSTSGKYAGMPVENIIGEHCYKVSHHSDIPCFEAGEDCAVKHTFETGEAYTTIHTHIDKNNKKSFVELHSYPMKDSSGRIVAVIETANDITQKKDLEDQLRQAQKLESIGTLTGGIAHDFNNILTAILSYASVIQMKMAENDPLRQPVQKIIISAEKAANLTRGLLTFSRQHISNLKIADLNEIINGLVDNFSGAGIEIRRILSKEKLDIMADKGQIEQVLISLYSNARDAMPDRGTLFIETSIVEMDEEFIKVHGYGKTGKYAVIAVTDTGIGMDKNTIERIFDPFFTTKEVGKGTGIGLAVVYGIVQQHHGYLKCYSEPGKGTTFRIYLPMPIEKDEAYSSVSMVGGTETILLAEDDEKIRKSAKTMLESFGYNVIEASDGEEAIEKFEENKENINLLILDVIMPKKKGNEVSEEIQKTAPDVKALFISGYSAEALYEKGINQDKLNFIAKPVSPQDMLQKIRMALKH